MGRARTQVAAGLSLEIGEREEIGGGPAVRAWDMLGLAGACRCVPSLAACRRGTSPARRAGSACSDGCSSPAPRTRRLFEPNVSLPEHPWQGWSLLPQGQRLCHQTPLEARQDVQPGASTPIALPGAESELTIQPGFGKQK